MSTIFSRMQLILGEQACETLKHIRVTLFGLGGVGSYVAESLARAGIGTLHIIDGDIVCESNINRQLCAVHSSLGKAKTEVMADRLHDINPDLCIKTYTEFVLPDENGIICGPFLNTDYIIDAIDTVTTKIALAVTAHTYTIPIISAMGCANRLNPAALRIADIYQTSVCPLCRVMRHELKKRGIRDLEVVFSAEKVIEVEKNLTNEGDSCILGSVSWVPSVAGLLLSSVVVRRVLKIPI